MISQADAIRIPLPDQSIHCCVTSPPYWGLRKYAGDQGEEPLGLESTPERHIERIVEICREVRRVLRDDGVFWLNYGDCYASGASSPHGGLSAAADIHQPRKNPRKPNRREDGQTEYGGAVKSGFAQGSLMMMPHRVALALQQDGWIIRQDLVWFKRNPMPESLAGTRWVKHRIKVDREEADWQERPKGWQAGLGGHDTGSDSKGQYRNDDEQTVPKYIDCPGCEKCIPNDGLVLKRGSWRHTRAHEYVFMLTKKMQYWSNQEAVREKVGEFTRRQKIFRGGMYTENKTYDNSFDYSGHDPYSDGPPSLSGRNPRSVLDVPTAPYKGAHYATFPPNLIAPLIRATCPRWACPVCGQGWAAVVERTNTEAQRIGGPKTNENSPRNDGQGNRSGGYYTEAKALGYKPTCEHPHTQEEAVLGIVFDPFVGSGTTVKVAQDLLRRGIGTDISMEYLDQQAKVRAGLGTPSNALEDLPLFADML